MVLANPGCQVRKAMGLWRIRGRLTESSRNTDEPKDRLLQVKAFETQAINLANPPLHAASGHGMTMDLFPRKRWKKKNMLIILPSLGL
jgi:hypothetical protein